MKRYTKSYIKYCTAIASIALSIGLTTAFATPAWSSFKPKNPTRPRGASSTAAVRGSCVPGDRLSLTAIAPRTLTGMTQDETPTLTWYVPDEESYEMDLNLYEYDLTDAEAKQTQDVLAEKTLKRRMTMQTQPGLMQWTVPEELRLEAGKRYRWEVVLYCNINRPSEIAETSAEIQLEPMSVSLQTVTDPVQRSQIYGEAGLWYEAFAEVATGDAPAVAARRRELVELLLSMESEMLGAEPEALKPEDLLIQPEADLPLVRLAKRATRQLMALLEVGL